MNDKVKKAQQQAREEALKKAHVYQNLFDSKEGKIVLDDLRDEFDMKPLTSEWPHYTHVRAGHLEVLRYIEDVLNVDTTIGEEDA